MKARLLLADDHTIVMEGLRAILEAQFQVIGTVSDGRAAVKAVTEAKPDVVILDVSMPLLNGIDAAKQIHRQVPQVKIVFLTMHNELSYVQEAFEAGASAYVIKHSASEDLGLAINKVLTGRTYVTPSLAKHEIEYLDKSKKTKNRQRADLSTRQREILQLIAEGKSAKQAAAILHLSSRTVEFHKYRIMRQLGLQTTAQLMQFAIKNRIITE